MSAHVGFENLPDELVSRSIQQASVLILCWEDWNWKSNADGCIV